MCDKKEKIFFILCELQKLSETDNGLLKELEQIHEILKHLIHDWEKLPVKLSGCGKIMPAILIFRRIKKSE